MLTRQNGNRRAASPYLFLTVSVVVGWVVFYFSNFCHPVNSLSSASLTDSAASESVEMVSSTAAQESASSARNSSSQNLVSDPLMPMVYPTTESAISIARAHLKCLEDKEDRTYMDPYYAAGGDPAYQMNLHYLAPKSVVFDIGGNKGGFVEFAVKYPVEVHVFEPVKEFHQFLINKYPKAGYPQLHFHNYGIDKKDGESRIIIDGVEGSASSQYSGDGAQGVLVSMKTLDAAMKEIGVQKVDLINVNCEGCEFAVMESIVDQKLLPKVQRFQVQYHPGAVMAGTVRRCSIRQALQHTHKEEYNFPWIWERWVHA